MRTTKWFVGTITGIGLVLAVAGVAAAQDVKTDFDKSIDFSHYKTFAAQIKTSWESPFAEKRALEEIVNTLTAKGWQQADEATADVVVMVNGASQTKRDVSTFYTGGGYRYYGGGMATTTVNEFKVGSMIVDMFDAKSKNLIWRSVGTDELSDSADKNQKKIVNATKKMFKNFPPRPSK